LENEELYFPGLEALCRKYFNLSRFEPAPLSAHGSDRKILRIHMHDNSIIGIYNNNLDENKAFLSFTENFHKYNLHVPEIFAVSDDMTCYLMEDLGDLTLFNYINENRDNNFDCCNSYYKKAINELIKFQVTAGKTIDHSLCYQFNEFGEENIEYDLNYFHERFLKGLYYSEHDKIELNDDFEQLKSKLLEIPRDNFLYRDFQSRNIMLKNGEMYFIDYQSGRKGALQYDLASLLFDAKADVPNAARETLLTHYIEELKRYISFDDKQFRHYFWYFVIIRILQAMGAYGFLSAVKGKKRFLESVPYALKNITYVLDSKIDNNELIYLRNLFNRIQNEGIQY